MVKEARKPRGPREPGTLYLVGTPVGNLEDITLRALRVLKEVDLIAAEDTRRTRKLAAHYGITARAASLHRHNEARRAEGVIAALEAGQSVALVSDAGMPGVSDPGAALVRLAAARGIPITVVPGPSAVVAALSLSGFAAPAYVFAGFLPRRSTHRRRFLESLATEWRPVVFFEAPHRIAAVLLDIESTLPDRPLVVGRELTKRFEQVLRGTAAGVRAQLGPENTRGEFTVVIGPPARKEDAPTPWGPGP
jgi:16S rRNA (cytidine1402-2'-O)-methyltransferase